jgi:hypothetical protein
MYLGILCRLIYNRSCVNPPKGSARPEVAKVKRVGDSRPPAALLRFASAAHSDYLPAAGGTVFKTVHTAGPTDPP